MTLDYFYGTQADQFTFYRIPKVLFTDERFKPISAEAKILYGILLDRMSLSRKNGWLDDSNRVFIIYTLEEVMDAIGCADQKATKLLNELENKAGLIERKRLGLGKPNLIYDKTSLTDIDGGQLDLDTETLAEAALEICAFHEIGKNVPLQVADIGILDKILAVQNAAIAIEPPVQEADTPAVDVLPDPAISVEARNAYGYG